MRDAALILVLLILCVPAAVFAGPPLDIDNFLYSASITGPLEKGTLYRVSLSEEILRNCSHGCADARILDQDRNEIPYVIIESREKTSGGENYIFEITGYDDTPELETVTMRLRERHYAISSIRIQTQDRDFRKQVEVYGSHDLKTWNLLAKDSIWDFSSQVDLRKTEITFPESDYRYYRLVFRNAADKKLREENIRLRYRDGITTHELDFSVENAKKGSFHIDRVEGRTPQSRVKPVYDEVVFSSFSSRKDGDHTIMDIEAAVPFESVLFDIADSYYFRKVNIYFSEDGKKGTYRLITTGQVYSFPLSETIEAKNEIECPGSWKGHYRFEIEDRSNPPLEIRNIKFKWVRRNLYFIALGHSPQYSLHFGNPSLKKPEYDIAQFVNQCNWQTHSARDIQLAPVVKTTHYRPAMAMDKKEQIEKAVLISIVVLLVGVIGYWLYSLVKNADFKNPDGDH